MKIKRDTKYLKVKCLVEPHKDRTGFCFKSEINNDWHMVIDNEMYF